MEQCIAICVPALLLISSCFFTYFNFDLFINFLLNLNLELMAYDFSLIFLLFLGYGFVDFESPTYAENAVKALTAKGVKAQMAKVGVWVLFRPAIVRFCF